MRYSKKTWHRCKLWIKVFIRCLITYLCSVLKTYNFISIFDERGLFFLCMQKSIKLFLILWCWTWCVWSKYLSTGTFQSIFHYKAMGQFYMSFVMQLFSHTYFKIIHVHRKWYLSSVPYTKYGACKRDESGEKWISLEINLNYSSAHTQFSIAQHAFNDLLYTN